MKTLFPLVLALLLTACAGDSTDEPAPLPEIPRDLGVAQSGVTCDAGDRAFVRRAIFDLWGRRPLGVREIDLLAEIAVSAGREGLIDAMLRSSEYRTHWGRELRDILFVNRAGSRANEDCFGDGLIPDVDTSLALHVRDTAPDGLPYDTAWNMTDLVHSTLQLDDLSAVLGGHLFTQAGSEIIDADDPNDEMAWRTAYADLFMSRMLNRRMECLTCHNSEFSVTGNADPALDRTWEVPGLVEKALFGASVGRAASDISTLFRIKEVLALELDEDGPEFWLYGEGVSPWGMSPGCGQFIPRDEIPDDFLGGTGYLVRDFGPRASLWDLEGLVRSSFAALRGRQIGVAESGDVDGEQALAWTMSMALSEQVWQRVMGAPLTTPFGFPRNVYQRDVLAGLSRTLVETGYSLKAVLKTTLLHPYYNQSTPDQCTLDTPYYLSPLFDPWVVDNDDQELRNNSVGELLRRAPARVLLNSVTRALEWSEPRLFFPDDDAEGVQLPEDAAFQRDIGAFVRDGETGFRGSNFQETLAWEYRYGACADPDSDGEADDFIDHVVSASVGRPLEDAVIALKDRLLSEPALDDPDERALVEALLGTGLDTPVGSDSGDALRRVCSALLAAPQFVLGGVTAMSPPSAPDGGVVPVGADLATLCEALANTMAITCTDGRLVL